MVIFTAAHVESCLMFFFFCYGFSSAAPTIGVNAADTPIVPTTFSRYERGGGLTAASLHSGSNSGGHYGIPNRLSLSRLDKFETVLRFIRDDCQAELVCFVDGPDSRDNYVDDFENFRPDRKNERYENDIRVIDGIQEQQQQRIRHSILRSPTDRILFDSIKTLANRYGRVWYALNNARRLEIARYAVEHGALAVLSKQSDYLLVVDKHPLKVWYIPALNLNTMTVSEFDHGTICRAMQLNTAKKRRLMAALLPSSVMGPHALGDDLPQIYNLVRSMPANITREVYNSVAERLFGSTDKADALQKACEKVYDTANIQLSVQEKQLTGFAYDILHNRTSTITLMLNDLRYWESKGIDLYQLVVDFYGRLAGVVLARNDRRHGEPSPTRQIRIKQNHEVPFGYHTVEVKFPEFELNSVIEAATNMINQWNFECLKFVFELDLPIECIHRLVDDEEHRLKLLDYTTVYYMVQKRIITSDMADIILLTVEQQFNNGNNTGRLLNSIPTTRNMEAFHATFMYIRWRFNIYEALVNSGFPAPFIDNETRLDGVKMQNLYTLSLSDPGSLQEYGIDRVRERRLHD